MRYRRFVANLVFAAILAAVYFGAAKLGLALAFVNASATAVWPPTGIALAALLVLGTRVWPGILLGAFLANLTTAGSAATSLGIAIGNTLEGLVGVYLVQRFANGRSVFDRSRDVFTFVILAGIVSTAVSATLGVTVLCLGGFASWANYGPIWLTWWLGDAVGALVVTPPLVLWSMNPRLRWNPRQVLEIVILLLALLLVGLAVFGRLFVLGIENYPLEFICIPLLIWAAFRFGQREAATAACILSGIAIWGTIHGSGPFIRDDPNESLLLLQVFMGIVAVMSLVLAAAVAERKQAEEALRKSKAQIEAILQGVSDGVSVQDGTGRLVYANDVAAQMSGYSSARALLDAPLAEVIQQFEILDEAGQPFPLERLPGRLALQGLPGPETLVRFRVHATGEERWSVIKATPVYDEYGQAHLAINTLHDITVHKQAEEQLRHAKVELEARVAERTAELRTANEQLQAELTQHRHTAAALAEAQRVAHLGSWAWHVATNRVTWSDELYRLFALQPQECALSYETYLARVHPDDRALVDQAIQLAHEDHQPFAFDHRIIWPHDTVRWLHGRGEVVVDETGRPIRIQGTAQDITEHKQAEEQLRFQKTLFECQSEAAIDGILVVSSDQEWLSFNRRFGEIWDLPAKILEAKSRAVALEAAKEKVVDPEQFSAKIAWLYEHRDEEDWDEIALKDGRTLERYSAPVRSADGVYYGRVWYYRDISQRQRAEAALRVSEERFSKVFHANPATISITTLAGGRFLDVNESFLNLMGYQRDEVIGHTALELGVWADPEDRTRVVHALREQGSVRGMEISFRTKSGEILATLASIEPIDLGGERCILTLTQDISARKRVEAALRASQARLAGILDIADDAIIAVNARKEIELFNQGAERIFGYTAQEVLGRALDVLLPAQVVAAHRQHIDTFAASAGVARRMGERRDIFGRRHDGTEFPAEASISKLVINDEPVFTVMLRDITARKRAEDALKTFANKLEHRNRELQEFASVASHDLQEPLRKVQAFGDLLKTEYAATLDVEGRDYLERMQNAASRMQTLINDLLMLARLGSEARPFVVVDLNRVAREVVADLEAQIVRTGGRVDLGDLPTIEADPLQMRQLLQNVIGNALKFCRPEQPPVVKIRNHLVADAEPRLAASTPGDSYCRISVEDNGIGFDEKYLDRIFAVFQRLHGRGAYEGTGIGLAVCRRIVERHGGSITATSTPGQGTTFIISLPVNQPSGRNGSWNHMENSLSS